MGTVSASDSSKFRFVGTTDECIECQRCGKTDLRSTVVLAVLDADGNEQDITYYGSSCAARVLGRTGRGASARVLAEARAAHAELAAAAQDGRTLLAFYGVDEHSNREEVEAAAAKYAHQHRHAMWAPRLTTTDWIGRVHDMITRRTETIRRAELIGL